MQKIDIDLRRDITPDQHILTDERGEYVPVKTITTYGFPIVEVEGRTIARIVS